MKTFKKITFMLAAIAPLAISACNTASADRHRRAAVRLVRGPGNYGNTFVDSPEPGFNPDTIEEAP